MKKYIFSLLIIIGFVGAISPVHAVTSQPDLTWSGSIYVNNPDLTTKTVLISIPFINSGGTEASFGYAIKLEIYKNDILQSLSWQDGPAFGQQVLLPEASRTYTHRTNYQFIDPGIYQITLIIDPDNVIAESDENNNVITTQFSVSTSVNACTDSDGGKNPDIVGLTDGRVNGIGSYFNDTSVTINGGICSGDACAAVAEGYCENGQVKNILTQCPSGYAQNGACTIKPNAVITLFTASNPNAYSNQSTSLTWQTSSLTDAQITFSCPINSIQLYIKEDNRTVGCDKGGLTSYTNQSYNVVSFQPQGNTQSVNVDFTITLIKNGYPTNESKTVTVTFAPTVGPMPVNVTSPAAGQNFTLGNTVDITWTPASSGIASIQLIPASGGETTGVYGMKVFGYPINYNGSFAYNIPTFGPGSSPGSFYFKLYNPEPYVGSDQTPGALIGQSGIFTISSSQQAPIPILTPTLISSINDSQRQEMIIQLQTLLIQLIQQLMVLLRQQ